MLGRKLPVLKLPRPSERTDRFVEFRFCRRANVAWNWPTQRRCDTLTSIPTLESGRFLEWLLSCAGMVPLEIFVIFVSEDAELALRVTRGWFLVLLRFD